MANFSETYVESCRAMHIDIQSMNNPSYNVGYIVGSRNGAGGGRRGIKNWGFHRIGDSVSLRFKEITSKSKISKIESKKWKQN